jgi:hypothetical protein
MARSEYRSLQLVALLAYDLANDRLGFRVPVPLITVITDADGKLHAAEYISFVGPLLKGDLLGFLDETALFAKIARVSVARTGHVFDLRSMD